MVLLAWFAAALIGATSDPSATDAPRAAALDVFTGVLADPRRAMIDRDARCKDARTNSDTFAASKGADVEAGIAAMNALEKCSALPRVGDWSDYRNYLITAAAATAYQLGVTANEPKALQRAIADASAVEGYRAGNKTVISSSKGGFADPRSATGAQEMAPLSNGFNDRNATTTISHVTPLLGTYGQQATAIADASEAALAARSESRPQAK